MSRDSDLKDLWKWRPGRDRMQTRLQWKAEVMLERKKGRKASRLLLLSSLCVDELWFVWSWGARAKCDSLHGNIQLPHSSVSLMSRCNQSEWRLRQVFTPVVWSLITFNWWRLVLGSIQHLFERLQTQKKNKSQKVNGFFLLRHWYKQYGHCLLRELDWKKSFQNNHFGFY